MGEVAFSIVVTDPCMKLYMRRILCFASGAVQFETRRIREREMGAIVSRFKTPVPELTAIMDEAEGLALQQWV